MITWSFTIGAAIALVLTLRKLRRHVLNRRAAYDPAVIARLEPPKLEDMRLVGQLLVWWSLVLNLVNVVLLVVGIGALSGHRELLWALVALPVLTVLASFFDPA